MLSLQGHRLHRAVVPTVLVIMIVLAGCTADTSGLSTLTQRVEFTIPTFITLQVVYVVCGAALLLAGWRLHSFIVAVPAFAIGGSLGVLIASRLGASTPVTIGALVIGGLICMRLALRLVRLGIFAAGALTGAILANSLWPAFTGASTPWWGYAVGALVGGFLLLALRGIWIPVLSSVVGAALVAEGVGLDLRWIVGLCIAGILVQFGILRAIGQSAAARPARR